MLRESEEEITIHEILLQFLRRSLSTMSPGSVWKLTPAIRVIASGFNDLSELFDWMGRRVDIAENRYAKEGIYDDTSWQVYLIKSPI